MLKCYKAGKEIPVRDYLHIVLHCVYRHMFMDPTLDRPLWDLSCDIAVENIISELGLKSAAAARERAQASELAKLKSELKYLTAEKLYAHYQDKKLDPVQAADLRGLFYADNHEIWYMTSRENHKSSLWNSRWSLKCLNHCFMTRTLGKRTNWHCCVQVIAGTSCSIRYEKGT